MELNPRQFELAIRVRTELLKNVPRPEGDDWVRFIDITRAVAVMLDGLGSLTNSKQINQAFRVGYVAFSALCIDEHNRILVDLLGEDGHRRMREHPEGRAMYRDIMARVEAAHGAEKPPIGNLQVDVEDILIALSLDEGEFGNPEMNEN